MIELFRLDYERHCHQKRNNFRILISVARDSVLRGTYFERMTQTTKIRWLKGFLKKYSRRCLIKKGIEIDFENIGGGCLLVHAFDITINSRAIIGENFTIFKGATIGSIRSGGRQGAPLIGNRVTVCSNAFVCGKISIGDDVLIAANAFVNFDVPSNSVVIGNPGVIHHKDNPSIDYLA